MLIISGGTFWSGESNLDRKERTASQGTPSPFRKGSQCPVRPSAGLMNMDTILIDGAGSAMQRKTLSEGGRNLDMFYGLIQPLRAARGYRCTKQGQGDANKYRPSECL